MVLAMDNTQKEKYYLAMQELKEDIFTKEILLPLFKSMNYDRVEFHGGPSERGRDLIATSILPPPKKSEYILYIQTKKLDKKKSLCLNELSRLCRQIKQARSKGFTKGCGKKIKPDYVYIAIPNKLTQRFLEELEDELCGDDYKGWLEFYDCVEILRHIEEYCPSILEKLEPFEDKIANPKGENTIDRNHELLGALCSVRDSIDISKFYSDLSFFVGSIDSRILVTYKVNVTTESLNISGSEQWSLIKDERKKIIDLIGFDIFKDDLKDIEDKYNNHYISYISDSNRLNQTAYISAFDNLSFIIEEFDTNASMLLERLDIEKRKQSRFNHDHLDKIIDELKDIRLNLKNKKLEVKLKHYDIDYLYLDKTTTDLFMKTFSFFRKHIKIIKEQCFYVDSLEKNIITEPYYDISIRSFDLENEISERVDQYGHCVKSLNSDDRPNMAEIRRLLDSVEISLKFFECIYTKESLLSSIVELKKLDNGSDRVSISAHDVFYTGKDIAIYGGAGVGKTTTLEMFFKYYEENINKKKVIFCSLNRVIQKLSSLGIEKRKNKNTTQEELDKVIYSIILISYGFDVNIDTINRIKQYLEKGVVLIFDGLDEIVTEYPIVLDAMNKFKNRHQDTQWIISSRDCVSYLKEINFLGITLLPFTHQQLKNFILGWFNGGSEGIKLWNDISGTVLHDNLLTPLVATILCSLVERGIKAPTNESEIYSERLSLLLGKYDANKNIRRQIQGSDELLVCAKNLAWAMHFDGIRNIKEDDAIKKIINKVGSKYTTTLIKNCVRELEDPCAVLVRDKVSGELSFGHFRFQEHLASLELKENRSIDFGSIITKDWWRGAFSLYAQNLDDIESIIEDLTRGSKLIPVDAFTTLYAMSNVLSPIKKKNMTSLLDHLKKDLSYLYDNDYYDYEDYNTDYFHNNESNWMSV